MASEADPLPYFISFGLLFLVMLGLLTWALDLWYQQQQCGFQANIWCADDWVCNSTCQAGRNVSDCFKKGGETGLASCLFGPTSAIATTCFLEPNNSPTAPSCTCPSGMSSVNSCLSGCPTNLNTVSGGNTCCCKVGLHCTPNVPACQGTT